MCDYCKNDGYYKPNKSLIRKTLKNNVDIDLSINIKDKKLVASIENLSIKDDNWFLPVKKINYCPMCRKEARRKMLSEEELKEHYRECWQSTVKELQDLAKYVKYLEEKLMYALGPKNKEFDYNTKFHFSNILRKGYYENRDIHQIKQSLLTYYNHKEEDKQ